jgi:hypothetical protein
MEELYRSATNLASKINATIKQSRIVLAAPRDDADEMKR